MRLIFFVILIAASGFLFGNYDYGHDSFVSNNTNKPVQNITTQHKTGYPPIQIAPTVVHNLSIRHTTATVGNLQRNIETLGKITRVDPMARRTITPPIRGELAYIAEKQSGEFINRDELLFVVVSEELFDLQKVFQTAFLSGSETAAIAMIPHMRQMGLTQEQIERLKNGDKPELAVEVYASEDSYIFSRRGKVGESVHKGFTVFNVGGHYNVIEVTAEIFERQWAWVEVGQKAIMTVRGLPGSVFEGTVVRVQPPVGYTTRSLEVALKFNTDDRGLSQSMFAHVTILGKPKENILLIPQDAVIRTGSEQRVVLIQNDGSYLPVVVGVGEEVGGMVEIRSGLQENDRVVTSGQFLVDSESNLKADLERMSPTDNLQPKHIGEHRHHHY